MFHEEFPQAEFKNWDFSICSCMLKKKHYFKCPRRLNVLCCFQLKITNFLINSLSYKLYTSLRSSELPVGKNIYMDMKCYPIRNIKETRDPMIWTLMPLGTLGFIIHVELNCSVGISRDIFSMSQYVTQWQVASLNLDILRTST